MLVKGALFSALYFTVDSVLERKNSWITLQVFVAVTVKMKGCYLLCKEGEGFESYIRHSSTWQQEMSFFIYCMV